MGHGDAAATLNTYAVAFADRRAEIATAMATALADVLV